MLQKCWRVVGGGVLESHRRRSERRRVSRRREERQCRREHSVLSLQLPSPSQSCRIRDLHADCSCTPRATSAPPTELSPSVFPPYHQLFCTISHLAFVYSLELDFWHCTVYTIRFARTGSCQTDRPIPARSAHADTARLSLH